MLARSRLLGADRHRYGQVRAWGSVAFVVSATIVGVVLDRAGPRSIFAIYLPALLLTAVVTAFLPRKGTSRSASIMRGARVVLGSPGLALFLGGVFLVWTSLTALNAFYSIQIVALGGGATLVGLAWALGATVEVPIMFGYARLARRFGNEPIMIVGAFSFALRALLASLAHDPAALVFISILEGFSFGCFFVGGVTYVAGLAPTSLSGTAQGLFAATAGLATIVGSSLSGVIAGWITISGLFALTRGRAPDRRRGRGVRDPARAGAAAPGRRDLTGADPGRRRASRRSRRRGSGRCRDAPRRAP